MADSSVPRILAEMRRPGSRGPELVEDILCQIGKPQPGIKLDELADSLTALAISNNGRPAGELSDDASSAVFAITAVGWPGLKPGCTTYLGSYDRLIRIHKQATNNIVRQDVLIDLLRMPGDRGRALAYIRDVAISTDPTADAAVEALIQATRTDHDYLVNSPSDRSRADAILRDLYEHNLVKSGSVTQMGTGVWMLTAYSQGRGWVKGG